MPQMKSSGIKSATTPASSWFNMNVPYWVSDVAEFVPHISFGFNYVSRRNKKKGRKGNKLRWTDHISWLSNNEVIIRNINFTDATYNDFIPAVKSLGISNNRHITNLDLHKFTRGFSTLSIFRRTNRKLIPEMITESSYNRMYNGVRWNANNISNVVTTCFPYFKFKSRRFLIADYCSAFAMKEKFQTVSNNSARDLKHSEHV